MNLASKSSRLREAFKKVWVVWAKYTYLKEGVEKIDLLSF